jgi:hypothetical protein
VGHLIELSSNHDVARVAEWHVVAHEVDYTNDSNHETANELSNILLETGETRSGEDNLRCSV